MSEKIKTATCPVHGSEVATSHFGHLEYDCGCILIFDDGDSARTIAALTAQLAAAEAKLAEREGEIAAIKAIVDDDDLCIEVATNCCDPCHDIRYCSTSSVRGDGVDSYQWKLQERIAALTAPEATDATATPQD